MTDQDQDPAPVAADVERYAPRPVTLTPSELLPSDDEIRRMFRIAEAFALSGAYKDVNPEKAFAKMMIGRELGMTPGRSMTGVHLVEGGVQMHYSALAEFIRAREGYDFRAGWIKREGDAGQAFVWHDDEDPLDDREVTGAAVQFTVDGEVRGMSRFTVDDARKAQLIKDHAKAAWNAARRNMLLARAMSNGVKWFVPEVMGGMPVYAPGELEEARSDRPSLTASAHTDAQQVQDAEGTGIDLGPDVEKIIERAQELGHHGLANRAAIELALGGRAPGAVKTWVRAARDELKRFDAEQNPPTEKPVSEPEGEVTGEVVAEDPAGPENDGNASTATDAQVAG